MSEQNKLQMSFDPNTIEHLGVRMYSTLPPVMAELIANAYDADAELVEIELLNNGEKKVIVRDDGFGMSFEDINSKFLRIGRPRRQEENGNVTPKGRKAIGKKGIGKLSFFGIANKIIVSTKKEKKWNVFELDWESIKKSSGGNYSPRIIKYNEECKDDSGTEIILEIGRKSDFDPHKIAKSLSKIFIFDKDFKVSIKHNNGEQVVIENNLKYEDIEKQFEWNFPIKDDLVEKKFKNSKNIKGVIVTTKKPITPNTNLRGITLFSRNKLVNLPEYFSSSASSHFFSYLTGWLEVDFIDDLTEDVISTNRQSLNWNHPVTQNLGEYLEEAIKYIQKDWRDKRSYEAQKDIEEKTGIDLNKWYSSVGNLKNSLKTVIETIAKDSELTTEKQGKVIKTIHEEFVPEYPFYHWRHLHPEIREAVRSYYENEPPQYFEAAIEAVKLYIEAVRKKSSSTQLSEFSMMAEAFSQKTGLLLVTDNSDITEKNIQEGHGLFSQGAVMGFRNPTAHSSISSLVKKGLFTEKDCLDILSLISHLFYRLDNAKKRI
ncbi:TIGR02391 family protein [Patescibacteria group bacterium]|nr:TIGR02391 family protein [Patescibacteria group bacterium]MCG2698429.1 TIGR02391 family protein [Candidatus Parcubacteria bacterium]MBU4015381.1 TIGR02391 family protein [Patescibacteria group bacterium]MBU4026810.1 TIGR02391 family protein [Patescibacteria group bacterium]MBU4073318.1 TIGR02391 family protein [Patescibacteria group bacterium]